MSGSMPLNSRVSAAVQAALLVAASALCVLMAPPPLPFQRPLICADVSFIGRHAHILVNCDAKDFVELARDPSGALASNSKRQTRPGYGVIGWIASLPFRAIDKAVDAVAPSTSAGRRNTSALDDPYYAGYVALNGILMTVAALLLLDILGTSSLLVPAAIVPAAVLLVNHITKAFFWTANQQILTLVAATLSIWLARRRILANRLLRPTATAGIGFAAGTACLVYGVFVLVPATLTAAFWIYVRSDTKSRTMLHTCILWLGTIIPLAAWRWYVIARTGSFYSFETQFYHQFVWIADRWKGGGPAALLEALQTNIGLFAETIPEALGLPLAFTGAAIVLVVSRRRWVSTAALTNPSAKAAAAFLLVAVPFYALMGFYAPRLTAALVVPLIVMLGCVTVPAFEDESSGRYPWVPEPITLAAIGYAAIVIFVRGPYA